MNNEFQKYHNYRINLKYALYGLLMFLSVSFVFLLLNVFSIIVAVIIIIAYIFIEVIIIGLVFRKIDFGEKSITVYYAFNIRVITIHYDEIIKIIERRMYAWGGLDYLKIIGRKHRTTIFIEYITNYDDLIDRLTKKTSVSIEAKGLAF